MMILNKFVVNRLAYLIALMMNEEWRKLYKSFTWNNLYGTRWDPAEPDDGGMEYLFDDLVERAMKQLHEEGVIDLDAEEK